MEQRVDGRLVMQSFHLLNSSPHLYNIKRNATVKIIIIATNGLYLDVLGGVIWSIVTDTPSSDATLI